MRKNKITKEYDVALREIAAKIPAQDLTPKPNKTGAELLRENPKATDKDGKPINPKLTYSFRPLPAVNHYKQLRKAFESGGDAEVLKYMKRYGFEPKKAEAAAA